MIHPGQLLKSHGLYAGKELGQNFLSNPQVALAIVEKAGIGKETPVLEIGPGLGALTVHIARKTRQLTVVEKDRRLIPVLEQVLSDAGVPNVRIVNQDILQYDMTQNADKNLVVIGNLPYNISSQIMFKLVQQHHGVKQAFLMFQKELAQRITAVPGGKQFSRLAAVVQYAARVYAVADIGPANFFPRPQVDSAVLGLDFLPERDFPEQLEPVLFGVIKAAFSKRRKSLKNSLSGGEFNYDKQMVTAALEQAGIDPVRRAETLSVAEFKRLALAVNNLS